VLGDVQAYPFMRPTANEVADEAINVFAETLLAEVQGIYGA
jgi:hypothetical protein